jgi:hypothetical protein
MSLGGSSIASVGSILGGSIAQDVFERRAGSEFRQGVNRANQSLQNSQNQALGYLKPYNEAGSNATGVLSGLLTGSQYNSATGQTTILTPEQRNNLFQQSPGYQFRLNEVLKALQNSQVARGGLLSGGAAKEIGQYSQGLASQEYSDYLNQLTGLANLGSNAAANSANTVSQIGGVMSGNIYNGGAAQAQMQQNRGNIFSNAINQTGAVLGNSGGNGGGGGFGGSGSMGNAGSAGAGSSAVTQSGMGQLNPSTLLTLASFA